MRIANRSICILLLTALFATMSLPALADETQTIADLQLLADPQSDTRMDAINRLMESKDGRVADVLEAYRVGKLRLWNDKLVLADPATDDSGSVHLRDALSGEPIVDGSDPIQAQESALKTLVASRKERRSVVNAIRLLELYSPDLTKRLSAISKLGDLRNTDYLDELDEIVNSEIGPQERRQAHESMALIRLATGDAGERLASAAELGDMASARAIPLIEDSLEKLGTGPGDAGAVSIYKTATKKIEKYQRRVRILGYLFSGLSLGSVLLLMALGLSIVFGQMGVINMAHGELMMIGAYATYEVQRVVGHSLPDHPANYFFWIALPASFLVAAAVGWLMEKFIVRHLYGRPLETLLATWGLGLMLIQVVRIRYGDNIGVNSPTWLVGGIEIIQDFYLPYNRLFIIGLTAACVTFVYWLLNRTKRGLLVRATVQNREMAAALGVNTRYADGFTFAFGAGLAGIAGCALTLIGGVTPDMGQNYIVDSFLVVVTGGVGQIAGAIWAGLGLGVLNKLLEPTFATIWSKVLILLIVIAFIQYRPAGLFPPKGRFADV